MPLHLNINQLKAFEDNLIRIKHITFPQICNQLLSVSAFEISNTVKQKTLPQYFKLRNKFAPLTIRYNRAQGYNLDTMFSMVGQLQNFGSRQTKTHLEENELGKDITASTTHTVIGLPSIRQGQSFSGTVKKNKYISKLKPVLAQNILRNFRYNDSNSNTNLELSRISGLVAMGRINTLNNKPVIAHNKQGQLGVYEITPTGISKVRIKKLYSLKGKTTKLQQARPWLKTAYSQVLQHNLPELYQKTARYWLEKNKQAFNARIQHS